MQFLIENTLKEAKKITQVLIFMAVCICNLQAQNEQKFEFKRNFVWNEYKNYQVGEIFFRQLLKLKDFDNSQQFENLPLFKEVFNTKGNEIVSVSLEDEVYNQIDLIESKWAKILKNNAIVKSQMAYEKGIPKTVVSILPIRLSGSKLELLQSANIVIRTRQNSNLLLKKKASYAANSVLSTGDWFKIGVVNSGVQKIDYNFLKQLGMNLEGLNPKKIRLYGNGAGMLAQPNSAFRFDDLEENNIWINGESDGKFNAGDYILFYGKSQKDNWIYDASANQYLRKKNIYSDTTYYFITVSSLNGARISTNPSSINYDTTITNYDFLAFVSDESKNLVKSGRNWVGKEFDRETTQQGMSVNVPFIVPNSEVKIRSSVVTRSFVPSQFNVSVDGNTVLTHIDGSVPSSYEYYANSPNTQTATFKTSNTNISLIYDYNKPDPSSIGWINFIELCALNNLVYSGGSLIFSNSKSIKTSRFVRYSITTGQRLRLWDVSNQIRPSEIVGSLDSDNGVYNFTTNSDSLKTFVAFDGNNFNVPVAVGKINNQNLHGMAAADNIIITHPSFINEANRLAGFHKQKQGLKAAVVNIQDIYNEFGSGAQDLSAIRDYLRMMYNKFSVSERPRFVTLFGRASYDFKYRIAENTNFVPTYESDYSYDFTNSYNSDDYIALLDDNEGTWDSQNDADELLDMGVGRLPVKNIDEAKTLVDKIIHYEATESKGDWQNKLVFVGDDEDDNLHINQANLMANNIINKYHEYNVQKIFVDAYPEVTGAGGKRNIEAQSALVRSVQKGCLVFNYTGHGGEVGLSKKRILNTDDINSWSNYDALPLFMTATCEFSRFDDPSRNAAGEMTLLNPNGGGIALFTTVRLVYISENNALSNSFYNNLGIDSISQLSPQYFGDIMRRTKNGYQSKNTRNFTLLGDPALPLAFPRYFVKTDSMNGKSITVFADTVKALSKVTISGRVTNESGNVMNDFNGFVYPTVFDKKTTYQTLQNNATSPKVDFVMQNNIIYKGKATVNNGFFSFTFIVPKDISYQYGYGKISYYSNNDSLDANGYYEQFIVGGTADVVDKDTKGPDIKLFMNDKKFVNGGTTDENPLFIATLFDENGINTVGRGVGRDLAGTLIRVEEKSADNATSAVILNDYYQASTNSYQSGEIKYNIKALSSGKKYTMKLRAFDVFNNSSESALDFVVESNAGLALQHVLNYPNPFVNHTTFHFDHNMANQPLTVQIQIFTISGKLIKTLSTDLLSAKSHFEDISWDGRDEYGDVIGKGVYIYKVKVKTPSSKVEEKFEKLVILN